MNKEELVNFNNSVEQRGPSYRVAAMLLISYKHFYDKYNPKAH